MTHEIIFALLAIIGVGTPLAIWDHVRLAAKLKTFEAEIRATVATDMNKVLNDIRADEKIVETHAYQIVSRVRAELRKVL